MSEALLRRLVASTSRQYAFTSSQNLVWAKVDRRDDCWLWTGAVNDSGYGVIWDGRRLVYAHRLSWLLHGFTIADRLDVDHLCFNRLCVRPAHLEAVTHLVNVRRSVARRRVVCCCSAARWAG